MIPLWKQIWTWEDNIKMEHVEMFCEDMNQNELAGFLVAMELLSV
jgi:hypothetical protein